MYLFVFRRYREDKLESNKIRCFLRVLRRVVFRYGGRNGIILGIFCYRKMLGIFDIIKFYFLGFFILVF